MISNMISSSHPLLLPINVYVPLNDISIPVIINGLPGPNTEPSGSSHINTVFGSGSDAVIVTSSPEHKIPSSFINPLVSVIVYVGFGNANTSTSISSVAVQPFTSVTVTVYVCKPTAGDTTIGFII